MTGNGAVRLGPGHIHVGERFSVSFQRTLRIPEDGREYPLPPGLGLFPLRLLTGGPALPMYQREALWIGFGGAEWKPNAVVVLAGGVNAVTGEAGDDTLDERRQNYVVTPYQPWLDGFNSGAGTVRQFVAVPLGSGLTAEAAITGREPRGGLELVVHEPLPGRFRDRAPPADDHEPAMAMDMGLGGGGTVRQRIYQDPHPPPTWDRDSGIRVRVALLNAEQWAQATGEVPPPSPVTTDDYARAGLPWFDLYDTDRRDVAGAAALAALPATGADTPDHDPADLPLRRLTAPK